jgi:biotin-dependent carboxylase-like uncharacterized protein
MRALTVLEAGPLTTVQDRGRRGWAHLGVPRAGALDAPAAALANRLVGNDPAAAVLETTFGGLAFTVSAAVTVAVTGALVPVLVDGRAAAWAEPVSVRAGQTVRLGRPAQGVRSYVALAGGVDVPLVLGSRSTETLAGVGPPVVRDGTRLPVGAVAGPPASLDVGVPAVGATSVLRFTPGPRDGWFADGVATLTGGTYAVAAASNRVGLRLEGPRLSRLDAGELPSEGIVLGAVQVTASGLPLVFLNDHPSTGGYPVLGVVEPADLPHCAQLRPGDRVRFTLRRGR